MNNKRISKRISKMNNEKNNAKEYSLCRDLSANS